MRNGRIARCLALLACVALAGCTVLEVHPLSGAPGDSVEITGTIELNGPVSVEFGGGAADAMPQIDAAKKNVVHATVPNGAQTGPITVHSKDNVERSSFDFTVLTNQVGEQEPNNLKSDVNDPSHEIPWGSRIAGALGGAQDVDWYFLKSGPPGPWAYTLEIQLANESPDTLQLTLEILTNIVGSITVGPGTAQTPTKETIWVTTVDDKKTFLKVERVLPAADIGDSYSIDIAKVAVADASEPNNSKAQAQPLPQGTDDRVYLTPAWTPGSSSAVGLQDYYAIPDVPVSGTVSAWFVSLAAGFTSPVKLQLYDKNGILRATALAPSADQPVAKIEEFAIPSGTSDGVKPWTLLVTTQLGSEPYTGTGSSPGRARLSYGLLVSTATP